MNRRSTLASLPVVVAISVVCVGDARGDPVIPVLFRPIGVPMAAGGSGGGRLPRGPFIGLDGGLGVVLASGDRTSQDAFAVGARVGYQARNGVSVFVRYDDLGVRPSSTTDARLQAATFGARYSIPFLVPLPFVEVMAGAAFGAVDPVVPTAAAGLGISLPIDRASIDLGARDWLASIDGSLRQTLTFQLGLSVVL